MSLRVRLGVVALVFLTVVLVAVGMSALMVRSWNQTVDERGEARMIADDVSELRLAFSDQETGVRGFQLDPEDESLQPYRDGVAGERRIVRRLNDREIDIPGFEAQLDAAIGTGETWRDEVAEPVIENPTGGFDEGGARAQFDALRVQLDELDQLVTAELSMLDREAERMRRLLFTVLFASALTAIVGTALAASLFRRWVTRPLAEISAGARRLTGDDTVPMPRFDVAELQDVSDAIDQLQASLRAARDRAVAALDGIEQSAVLAIQVRTELADELGEMPDGWDARTLLVPAEGVVAGDCFDIGLLDQGRMYVVLIDVTGHGASAALNALKAKSQLRAALRSRRGPGPALDWLSREMLKDERADLLTAFVAVIDLPSGRIRYANAGHPPPLLFDGTEVHRLDPGGPLVGAFEANWPTTETTLPDGSTLLVHTDGLTDVVGDERERFGDERLRAAITTADPHLLLERLESEVELFRRGTRTDDITAIAIHRAVAVDTGDVHHDDEHATAMPSATVEGSVREDTMRS